MTGAESTAQLTIPLGTVHRDACPECGSPLVLRSSKYGLFYGCAAWPRTKCGGSVGAHPDGRPLGEPADKDTKAARRCAHTAFDRLWKGGVFASRGQAYRWLADEMGMDQVHMAELDSDQCVEVVGHVVRYLMEKERHGQHHR